MYRMLFLVQLVFFGCSDRAPTKVQGTKATGARGTASPANAAPERNTVRYDPTTDPSNQGPDGFDLTSTPSPSSPAAARKKPFTIEALYRLPGVAGPRWSPDGKRILFTVARRDITKGKTKRDVHRINVDGSDRRRMTTNKASDNHPRWHPDGKGFFFVSSRGGSPQIWRMAIDGGEPEQVTDFSTGVDGMVLAGDGSRVAFSTRVFPDLGIDSAKNEQALDRIKKSTVQAHVADELLYRHWSSFNDGRRSHIMALNADGANLRDLTPGDYESPAFSLSGEGFALSPDASELCFVSNREQESAQAWTTNTDLWVVRTAGGKPTNITATNRAHDSNPDYSPDGRYIAFLRQETPGYESDRPRLAIYERKSGRTRILTDGFDNWVVGYQWSPDSRSIVFKAAVKGRFPLFRINLPDGKINRLALPSVRDFHVGPDGRLAFTFQRVHMSAELYVADRDGRKVRRLTHLSREVEQVFDIRPAEEIWIDGAGGKKIHTFIVKPHGFRAGKRYPLVINVHGGPQYQWTDRFRGDWQVYPGAGYVVAFFNPHGSIGYGQDYTAAISKDWGGKVYQDVMKATEALAKLPYVDSKRIGAMGWSYGGYMMNWLLGHTDRFKALVSMMGLYDLDSFYGATEELWFPEWDVGGTPWSDPKAYRKWSPSTYAAKFKTPTLVISGMRDFRVPYTQSLQLFTALRRQGVPARLVLFKNDGHWPSYVKSMPLYYAAHLDWFHRYLGGGPSPYDIKKMVRGDLFRTNDK